MNCQDFQATFVEIARDQIVDQRERETALAHTRSCPACAIQLADEQVLSAGLRRFAETSRTEQAPLRIEAALSAAFREKLVYRTGSVPVAVIPPMRQWRLWAVAAAAAVLVILALVAWRGVRTSAPQQAKVPIPQPLENAGGDVKPTQPRELEQPQKPVEKNNRKWAPRRPARELRRYVAQGKKSDPPVASARRVEIATEFIPMTGGNLIPLDGGHVVRVQLPRSALMSFGLPMNMERADERINAEVLVGDDGLARAIRFVR